MEASRTESVPRELPVHLEGLGKEYGHFTALKSLDLTVPEGTKGMKQRLAIAQARLHEPELLILDEPTSGLDPRGMAEVRDVIKSLTGEGRTIFMSSHLLGEVQEVCDDVALLNHGELLVHGSVRDLSRGADTSTFQTTFLRPPTSQDLEALASVPGVVEVKDSGDSSVDLRISGGEEGQARGLEGMVSRGLKVITYRPLGSSLEQLYLDRIQESDRL